MAKFLFTNMCPYCEVVSLQNTRPRLFTPLFSLFGFKLVKCGGCTRKFYLSRNYKDARDEADDSADLV